MLVSAISRLLQFTERSISPTVTEKIHEINNSAWFFVLHLQSKQRLDDIFKAQMKELQIVLKRPNTD